MISFEKDAKGKVVANVDCVVELKECRVSYVGTKG